MPDFEIYLQFDSFKPEVLEELREKTQKFVNSY